MRKIFLLSILLFFTALLCFASNKERIEQLQKEGQQLLEEINVKQIKVHEINGALKELYLQEEGNG